MLHRRVPARALLVLAVSGLLACVTFAKHSFADPDLIPDPLTDLRAQTAAMSEVDLEAASPSHPGMTVMLAERLARRDLRAQAGRIEELLINADARLSGSPALRVEAALLGARLLAFDHARNEAAASRLRAALEDPAVPEGVQAHARFGFGFLELTDEGRLALFLRVLKQHASSPYAPLAASEAVALAWDLGHRWQALEIEQGLDALPAGTAEARRMVAARLAQMVCNSRASDSHRSLPGKVPHRLPRTQSPDTARGLLLRLSPARSVNLGYWDDLQEGEQDHPEVLTRWTGDAPPDLLDGLPPARYLAIQAADGGVDVHLHEISAVSLESRISGDTLLLYACDARTGAPSAGARFLGCWERGSYPQRSLITRFAAAAGADGIARVAIDPPLSSDQSIAVRVMAWHADGCAWIETDRRDSNPDHDGCRVAVFASTPLVRPGQTIDFRLVAREPSPSGALVPPTGARFSVGLEDGSGKVFHSEILTVSAFGTVTAQAKVPEDAALGPVRAHVERQDAGPRIQDPRWTTWNGEYEAFSQFLCRVEEYHLPKVLVAVETDRPFYVAPATVRVTVRAQAAEGGPIAGFEGRLELTAIREDWTDPDPLAALPFLQPPIEGEDLSWEDRSVDLHLPDTACRFTTNAQGIAVLDLPMQRLRRTDRARVKIEAEGVDTAGRSGHGSARFGLVRVPARLRLALDWNWNSPSITGQVTLLDPQDQPVAAPVTAVLRTWDGQEVARCTLAAGEQNVRFDGLPGGSYLLEVTAEIDGRVLRANSRTWVCSGGTALRSERLTLKSEKLVFRLGETLSVRAIVPEGVRAVMATLENDRLIAAAVFPARDGSAEISFPLTEASAPNVRLVVSTWKNGICHQETLERFVDTCGAALAIEVKAEPALARPGQDVDWTVQVHDAEGRPVDAEVSLAIVDARVFAIQEDPAPSLLRQFAARPKRYAVNRAISEFTQEVVDDGQSVSAAFAENESVDDQAMPGYEPVVRKDFRDLLGWFPALRTGPAGKVTVRVRMSDSLTPWRATARALAGNGAAGEARGTARTLLPVTLRLDAPLLLRIGDEVEVGVLVRNSTDEERSGTVALDVEGLTQAPQGPPRPIRVPAGGSLRTTWHLKADQPVTTARLRAVANLGVAGDAVEKTLPVWPSGTRVPVTATLQTDAAGRAGWTFPAPHDPAGARIEIRAAPEDLERLLAPIDDLMHYPYGCVEQTMSGFMPAVVVRAALEELGVRPPALALQVASVSQAGVGRLQGFQHEDGGWGWWTGDDTDEFMTAYVVYGLWLARTHGVEVNSEAFKRGSECLTYLAGRTADPETRAFCRWVLAATGRPLGDGEAQPGPRSSPVEIACALRLAHQTGNREEVARRGRMLVTSARASEEGTLQWQGGHGFFTYPTVATSFAVEAMVEAGVEADAVRAGLGWLARTRQGGGFDCTLSNAFATLACARDLVVRGNHLPASSLRLRIDDREVAPLAAEAGDPVTRWAFSAPQALTLSFATPDPVRMGLWIRGEDRLGDDDLPADRGISWHRGLWRLLPGGDPLREEDWTEIQAGEPVAVGPVYEVRYRVQSGPEYLAIVDPRPAGLTPVSPKSGFDEASKTYIEWHESEITAFRRHGCGGERDVLVRLPVRFDAPGNVLWPAARAFGMYDETQQAFQRSRRLHVHPESPAGASGSTADEIEALHEQSRQAKNLSERAWSAWGRLALDMPEADRARVRRLARTIRLDPREWSKFRERVLDGLLRWARPRDPRDVDLLLDLAAVEESGPATVLSDLGTWYPYEVELARAAVQRRSETAWRLLGAFADEDGDEIAILDAFEELSPAPRAESLDDLVAWFAQSHSRSFTQFNLSRDPSPESLRDKKRLRVLLGEWLSARLTTGARFGDEAWTLCAWAHDRTQEDREDAAWVAFRNLAASAVARSDSAGGFLALPGGQATNSLLDILAERAAAEHNRPLWEQLIQAYARLRASPRTAIDALTSSTGDWRAEALDSFVSQWFAAGPPRDWADSDSWRQDTDRLVSLVAEWHATDMAKSHPLSSRIVCAFAWFQAAVTKTRGSVNPAWVSLRDRLHQRFAELDPVAAAVDGAFAGLRPEVVWDDPALTTWIGARWLELAVPAPDLVLAHLKREDSSYEQSESIAQLRAIPPAARAAILSRILVRDLNEARPWLAAFLDDPDPQVRGAIEQGLLPHVEEVRWLEVLARRPDVILGHLADASACTLAAAAKLNLEAAIPALRELARTQPDFLAARALSLRYWRTPAVHDVLVAVHAAFPKDGDYESRTALSIAKILTRPTPDAAAVFESDVLLRSVGSSRQFDFPALLVDLGHWGNAAAVLAAIADARDNRVATDLVRGAALRHDPRFQAAARADLVGSDARRDLAFSLLALDDSLAAREALVSWIATPAGKHYVAAFVRGGSVLPDDGSIHAGFLDGSVRGREPMVVAAERSPAATLAADLLPQLTQNLPSELALRLIREADANELPALVGSWIENISGDQSARAAAIPLMLTLATHILGPQRLVNDPACAALRFLENCDRSDLLDILKTAGDRELVACARMVVSSKEAQTTARLEQVAAGTDALLARHARAAIEWGKQQFGATEEEEEEEENLRTLPNPFADGANARTQNAYLREFGEDPFAPVRKR